MNEIEEVKRKINLLSYIKSAYNLGESTKANDGYLFKNCPICNSTSNKNGDVGHFYVNPITNSYSSFSGCCRGGSIIDFLIEFYKLDKKKAINKAKDFAGISKTIKNSVEQKNSNNAITDVSIKSEKARKKFIQNQKKQFILDNLTMQSSENKQKVYEYMQSRGISKETAQRYNLFISNEVYEDKYIGIVGTSRIVLPIYYENEPVSYVARALMTVEGKIKVLNSAGVQIPLNIEYIKKELQLGDNKNIYVCE